MEPPRRGGRFFSQIARAARRLAGILRRRHPTIDPVAQGPAMVGLPPSQRFPVPPAIPDEPAEHAKDFCSRYHDLLEAIVSKRMREAGVPEDRIGMIDPDFNFRLAVFHPMQTDGGGVHPPTGRINLDAGLFLPDLLAESMPAEVSSFHAKCPASVRLDAIIAHEYEEGMRGSHEAAEESAPHTALVIKEQSRRLLRAMRDRRV